MVMQLDGSKAFGEELAKRRMALGWSKERAAKEAKVSSITWKRVEDGLAVQDSKLAAIASAAGIRFTMNRDGNFPVFVEIVGAEPELTDHPAPVDVRHATGEIQILLSAKAKVMGKKVLTAIERVALQRNIEDQDLATFWERWELLSREQQLAISRQVDRMIEQEAADWVAEFGNPDQGEDNDEAQQEPGTEEGSTLDGGQGIEPGAPNTRAAASAAQSDFELVRDRGPIPSRAQQRRHDESYEAQTRDEPAPEDFNQDH